MWKVLAVVYRNVLAYLIASMAAGFTLSVIINVAGSDASAATRISEDPFKLIAIVVYGGGFIATGIAMIAWIPALPGALIGHYVRRGQMYFYAAYGTFAGLVVAFALRSRGVDDDPTVGPLLAYLPVACAGLVAGLTYWLIAGRKA